MKAWRLFSRAPCWDALRELAPPPAVALPGRVEEVPSHEPLTHTRMPSITALLTVPVPPSVAGVARAATPACTRGRAAATAFFVCVSGVCVCVPSACVSPARVSCCLCTAAQGDRPGWCGASGVPYCASSRRFLLSREAPVGFTCGRVVGCFPSFFPVRARSRQRACAPPILTAFDRAPAGCEPSARVPPPLPGC
jgi:hypothetical protein